MIDTVLGSGYNLILRVPIVLKDKMFYSIINYFNKEISNLICIFSTRNKCKTMYNNLQTNKDKIIYIKKRKITLSDSGNLLICTPERLDATLTFSSAHSWLNEFSVVIFYDFDLLLNDVRGNTLEACVIRISRFNPFIQKIFISTDIKNIEHLTIWTKSYLIDFLKKGKKEYDSKFLEEENVLTQSLIEIVSSNSRTLNDLKNFFKSSFAYFQGKKIPSLQNILSTLINNGLIIKRKNYYPTPLGKICAGLRIPIKLQLRFIFELKKGTPPKVLIEKISKDNVNFYNWVCHGIESISKLIGEKHE